MTSENNSDVKEQMREIFQDFSFETIKSIFSVLDLLLSRCNSFEDFKIGVRQTVDNLTERGKENE